MKRALASGIHAVQALLDNDPARVVRMWTSGSGARLDALRELAKRHGIPIESVRGAALDRMAPDTRHQGVVAEFRPAPPLDESELEERIREAGTRALVLVLDRVQDPHNLGACLRSAAAAGATAVVITRDRAASLTPAARKAAAGGAEAVPLAEVANTARALERMQRSGVWCVGLAGEAENSLHDLDLTGPLALVMGGEASGLRRLVRERCDHLARIPMSQAVESLNVSVAAGVALFEARRQRAAS